jgi:stage II sporulation protein D
MKHLLRSSLFLFCAALLCACAAPSKRAANNFQAAKGGLDSSALERAPEPPPLPQTKASPSDVTVRVLLAEKQKSALIKHTGRVYVYTLNLDKKYKVSPPGTLSVKALGAGKIQVGTLQAAQTIVLEPAVGTLLEWNKNAYSGKIYIIPAGNTFHLVEHAPLETYLYGVLPYEMSHSWPIEALKAQAVAARTYTLKTLEGVKNKNFDVFSDVRSQMYKGGGKQYDSVKKAVDETRGEVLSYQDKLFFTYYHANCGGGTDDVQAGTRARQSIKPLSGLLQVRFPFQKPQLADEYRQRQSETYAKSVGLSGNLKTH